MGTKTEKRAKRADDGRFAAKYDRTPAGSILITFVDRARNSLTPGGRRDGERERAARIYEVAAAIERYCAGEICTWVVSPQAFAGQLVVELSKNHDADYAEREVSKIVEGVL